MTEADDRAREVSFTQLRQSDGPVITSGNKVSIMYKIGLIDDQGNFANKWIYDSWESNEPFSFHFGNSEVISGLEVGINGMRVAESRNIKVPSEYAFGERGYKSMIGSNQDLLIEVYIVSAVDQ